jgi:ADP-ribosylglycohydrolase
MLGALVGDIVGSLYEFDNHRSKDFPFFGETADFTDDSVLTAAVADALLNGHPPQVAIYHWSLRYPGRGYGGAFSRWLEAGDLAPYGSWGNGAAMRVSPAALIASTLEEALATARRVTEVTHDHPEGIKGALATAHAIFLARCNAGAGAIRREIELHYGYDLDRSVDMIRPGYRFDESSQRTVPEAIVCALEARDFEDAIRNAISIGGDSDTLAAIAGPIAEARFGIPDDIAREALERVSPEMREVVRALYARSEYVHPIRSLRPVIPGSSLRRRYEELKPIEELPGGRTFRSRLATWESFLLHGRNASSSFHAQAARWQWDDGINEEYPELVALVMEAWPRPDDFTIN